VDFPVTIEYVEMKPMEKVISLESYGRLGKIICKNMNQIINV